MLFTDIEGSTRLVQQLPDQYETLLARHRSILRSAIAAHDGYEVGTEGDSFFVTFASARAAVNAAVDAQRELASEPWPENGRIRVRMGVHVGEVALDGNGYVGVEVHRAARLAAVGRGGQVLLSDAAVVVVGDRLPEGFAVRDAGEYELKDFDRPVRVHVLVGPGLADGSPTPIARPARRGHLPERRAAFIGRARELEALTETIRGSRLVTLTGPGGTGKTSLAIEAARAIAADYADGAWLVELGSLRDPEFVVATIHRVLGAAEDPARPPLESLTHYLADRNALLLLDNVEQLLPAVAGTVDELLRATSRLSMVATSREPLHVAGEQQVPVPPLGLPGSDASAQAAQESEAIRLFVDRAQAVEPTFELTDENRNAVQDLVRRVDGLPLAIELAAARVKLLEPAEILARLSAGSGGLSTSTTLMPERQRTLREAIGWSYRLLGEPERTLFARLAVFAGGFTMDAADAVANPGADLGAETLDLVGSLVDKSLLHRLRTDLGSRFEMLGTIRDFALEALAERDPEGTTAARHASFMTELAERAAPELRRPGVWRVQLTREIDNLRAAMAWAVRTGDADVGYRLLSALWRFWQARGLLTEGLDWAERLLNIAPDGPISATKVAALYAAGSLAYWHRDSERAGVWYRAGLAGAEALGDRRLQAEGWVNRIYLESVYGEGEARDPSVAEARERLRTFAAELNDPMYVAHADFATAGWYMARGEMDQAMACASNARRLVEGSGDLFLKASAGSLLARLAHARGEHTDAIRQGTEVAGIFHAIGDEITFAMAIRALASVFAQAGHPEAGARLAGFVARLIGETGILFRAPFEPEDGLEVARRAIGDERAEAAWRAGQLMTGDEALELVRSLEVRDDAQEQPSGT